MCMFCAAVPVAGAIGAKLNADQKRAKTGQGSSLAETETKPEKPITAITTGVIAVLLVGSVVYHTSMFGKA